MDSKILDSFLKEYDHKRLIAELDLDKRKKALFNLFPRLEQIEAEINSLGISTSKAILLNNDTSSLTKLNKKIEKLKKEKESILTSNGYDVSYLKPNYECSLCNDTGFVDENNKKSLCSCLKQRLLNVSYNNSNLSNLNVENFSNFNADLFSDEVDFSKFGQNISPRKNILKIKDKALDFVEHFEDPSYKNLLFTGKTGSRKEFYV